MLFANAQDVRESSFSSDVMHLLLQKTDQFIYLVKGTRVTRVKQQIFFLILENTLISGFDISVTYLGQTDLYRSTLHRSPFYLREQ